MRGLTIIVADADEARLRSALGLALSTRALGGAVRFFLDTAAAPLLRTPIVGHGDALWSAAGLPGLADLIEEALAADVTITVCQAGLAAAGITADMLDPRFAGGGMVGLLAGLGEDRLVVV